ncbi:Lysozyme-like domain protein [Metarhizium album ARSEF 1941]|uniref:Lysozyme-like domain protein n=1 Tax=Metarhizium album (strain ARSEF 1941) TaxID=1081103 RepID=A0A0B2WWK8_METAS|nr:Lysozyme-like domain protein [Metarhizium album ARSEF 1941]KHO00607.1 Lysozyme-like domain protein [Metarhizium album ARSEF 1941]
MFGNVALASACLAALVAGLPVAERDTVPDSYTFYQGDGSTAAGWPSMDSWLPLDELWGRNSALMNQTCTWNGWGADDSEGEIAAVGNAIQQAAAQYDVDSRFVLAVMMQESKGCVRAPTTNNGVVNPGLMQSHNGAGTCAGEPSCPEDTIKQMIDDGVGGTASGDGLKQLLAKARGDIGAGSDDGRVYYTAARLYNSGKADYTNLDLGLGSTACYASDIANRLRGWTQARSTCG